MELYLEALIIGGIFPSLCGGWGGGGGGGGGGYFRTLRCSRSSESRVKSIDYREKPHQP